MQVVLPDASEIKISVSKSRAIHGDTPVFAGIDDGEAKIVELFHVVFQDVDGKGITENPLAFVQAPEVIIGFIGEFIRLYA